MIYQNWAITKLFFLILLLMPGSLFALNQDGMQRESAEKDKSESMVKPSSAAVEIFEKYRPSLFKISTIERQTGEKHSIGSGFQISEDIIISNYHVISSFIEKPERFKITVESREVSDEEIEIVNFDIQNDLVALKAHIPSPEPLIIPRTVPAKGTRLFSLGNPLDFGAAILEGTYNGVVERKYPDRLHFSGAINSGMSGGPAVNKEGFVIGVNVSTYGSDIGMLVPVKYVSSLLEKPTLSISYKEEISRQLHQLQNSLFDRIFAEEHKLAQLGEYVIPTSVGDTITCWVNNEDETDYQNSSISCSSDDKTYVTSRLKTGSLGFHHHYYKREDLNSYRFYSFLENQISSHSQKYFSGTKNDFTNFQCQQKRIVTGGIPFYFWQCLRASLRWEGLYDAFVSSASIDGPPDALITQISIEGTDFKNYQRFLRRFIAGLSKREEK